MGSVDGKFLEMLPDSRRISGGVQAHLACAAKVDLALLCNKLENSPKVKGGKGGKDETERARMSRVV